jgi:DNA replication initiation complex subunit (GINS family)
LASSPEQTNHILKDLAQEERILYERLHSIIDEWKSKMLKVTDET